MPVFDYIYEFGMMWNPTLNRWEDEEDEEEDDEEDDEEDEDETENTINFEPYFSELVGKEKLYLEGQIPEKKINAFAKNFSSDFMENATCKVYYDDTMWGKGDDGFAIVNHNGTYYLLIKELGAESVGFCLGEDETNLYIKAVEYNTKNGLTIVSLNPDKQKFTTKYFRGGKVFEALYDFLVSEFSWSFDDEDEDDFNDPANIRA